MKSNLFIGLGIGCFLLLGIMLWRMWTPSRLSFDSPPATHSTVTNDAPMQLLLPTLGMALPIFPSEIKNNKWETTTRGVSYLASSAIPGETGNSVFYGHNWPNLLGRLTRIKPGDSLQVQLASGGTRNFRVEYTAVVSPDQTNVLDATPDARLTVYTCVGFLDTKRFVVVAVPA